MNNISEIEYLKSEYKKINQLFLLGRFKVVIEKTKKLIKKNFKQIPFYNLLALSYRETGQILLGEKVLLDALKINPNDQSVLVNLGSIYRVLIKFEKSEEFFKKALSINSQNINALVNYANLKRDTNNYNESIELYEKAYQINPNDPIILINLAGVYQIVGKFEISQKLLESLLKQDQNNALAHKMISSIKKYEINDKHQTKMLSVLEKGSLNEYEKATLSFAISKSFEDQKKYKKSFEFFKKANDIQKKIHKNYSVEEEENLFNRIKNTFEKTNFEKYPNYSNKKQLIFIVGLPRSGTTLAHQILASHSKVHGAGELVVLDQYMKINNNNENLISLFKSHQNYNDEKIKNIIDNYFLKIDFIQSNKNIILDKNPLNFQLLGYIKILFPNSKIIHCTRNLKDTALSIYKNAFEINSIVWSNDQNDLVKYISIYMDLINFWKNKIPNFIYDLNYENLIKYKTEEIKKLLQFCELQWEEDCLNFNKKANPIKTVSVAQARKPIYNSSINTYENYNNYLGMFKNIDQIEKEIKKRPRK